MKWNINAILISSVMIYRRICYKSNSTDESELLSLSEHPYLCGVRVPSLSEHPSFCGVRVPSLSEHPSICGVRVPSLSEHPSICGVRVPQSSFFHNVFVDHCLTFVFHCFFAIVFPVLRRFLLSDYCFGKISKPICFLYMYIFIR
jgi:hypothetical protein